MKRILKIAGVVVAVLIIAVVTLFAVTFMGRQPIADGFESNNVRIVQDGMVSVGLVPIAENQVALIDAGNDKEAKAILAELSRRRLGPEAVVAILITHGHPDHIAGAGMFPKAPVMALETEAALVEGREGAKGPLPRLFPVSPTGITVARRLRDGETVAIGDKQVKVFAVPGHTQGSAAYLVNGVLFLGDAADAGSDGEIEGAPWVFSDSQAQDRASLVSLDERLAGQREDVKVLAFAHSGPLASGLAPLDAFAEKNR